MKRWVSIILVISLVTSLTGCAGTTPEAAVKQYFEAAKDLDVNKMADAICPDNKEDAEKIKNLIKEQEKNEYTKYFIDFLRSNAKKMSYQIKNCKTEGDTAIVSVDYKYVDGAPILMSVIKEVLKKTIDITFNGKIMSDKETQKIYFDTIKQQVETAKPTYIEDSIEIRCVKKDNLWYIEETGIVMLDMAVSGFLSSGENLIKSYGGDDD